MGPQAIACGDGEFPRSPGEPLAASMGPQAIACGDVITHRLMFSRRLLQWGRRQSPAEITSSNHIHPKSSCFNGAAGNRLRRFVIRKRDGGFLLLQWGRRQSPAEIPCTRRSDRRATRFNGAAGNRLRRWVGPFLN